MNRPNASTVVVILLVGIALGVVFANVLTAMSAAKTESYAYDHLAFLSYGEGGSVLAVDLRNGDVWRIYESYPERPSIALRSPRTSTVDPEYRGNFGLDRLDEARARALEGRR